MELKQLLGDEAEYLAGAPCDWNRADKLHLPGADFVERVMMHTDRSTAVTVRGHRSPCHVKAIAVSR